MYSKTSHSLFAQFPSQKEGLCPISPDSPFARLPTTKGTPPTPHHKRQDKKEGTPYSPSKAEGISPYSPHHKRNNIPGIFPTRLDGGFGLRMPLPRRVRHARTVGACKRNSEVLLCLAFPKSLVSQTLPPQAGSQVNAPQAGLQCSLQVGSIRKRRANLRKFFFPQNTCKMSHTRFFACSPNASKALPALKKCFKECVTKKCVTTSKSDSQ